jgi:hypothetical protein
MAQYVFPAPPSNIVGTGHGVYATTKADKKFQKVYKKALPFLGVSCKINQEWRTLPEMYQGLALSNFPLVALAKKVSFLLGNWGFLGQVPSDVLAMAYKNFVMEVGLYGCPLD